MKLIEAASNQQLNRYLPTVIRQYRIHGLALWYLFRDYMGLFMREIAF
jgi:hypothetical protein